MKSFTLCKSMTLWAVVLLFLTDTVHSETASQSLIVGNQVKAKNQSLYCSTHTTTKTGLEVNGTTCSNEASRVL